MNIDDKTPKEVAELLAGMPASENNEALGSSNQKVSLSYFYGSFVLGWSATAVDSYDWVGLYKHITDPDTSYVGGAWQWASRGSSYYTSVMMTSGYQARYLVWDATNRKYVSVARTDPFPPISVCSG
jgi:hypothetical protein